MYYSSLSLRRSQQLSSSLLSSGITMLTTNKNLKWAKRSWGPVQIVLSLYMPAQDLYALQSNLVQLSTTLWQWSRARMDGSMGLVASTALHIHVFSYGPICSRTGCKMMWCINRCAPSMHILNLRWYCKSLRNNTSKSSSCNGKLMHFPSTRLPLKA